MNEEENDLERLIRFSKAIANDIPTDDGEKLGTILIDGAEGDRHRLMAALATWLLNLDFTEEEALAILMAARTRAFALAFNTSPVEKELEA